MQKIKLREATKEFGLTNKLALFFLEKNSVPVKSHSSSVSMEQLEILRELSKDEKKIEKLKAEMKKASAKPKTDVKTSEKAKKVKEDKHSPEEITSDKDKELKEIIAKTEKEKKVEEKKIEPVVESKKKTPEKIEVKVATPPQKPVEKKIPVQPKKAEPLPPQKHKTAVKRPVPARERTAYKPKGNRFNKFRSQHHRSGKFEKYNKVRTSVSEITKPKKEADLKDVPKNIRISGFVTLKELADKINVKLKFIEDQLEKSGKTYPSNVFLDEDDLTNICEKFGVKVEILKYEDSIFEKRIKKSNAKLESRPPVVTVMGHVDHGKTTLLDTLRKTRVAAGEAGGITQSIGAYKIKTGNSEIVFIDTPGHEAFTNLRARGAKITDIVVLVVAANDGVKPQTIEAINHARAAGVPIIVAINKIDLDGADPDKVKQELSAQDLLVEDWGGDTVSVEISAKNNKNLNTLLEMINLVAEMQELKAYFGIPGWGTVIESRLDSKLGPLGSVLIQQGALKRGNYFICGNSTGKIRSLFDENKKALNEASAPSPVEIMGFETVPQAGERFQVVEDIAKAKKIIDLRKEVEKGLRKDEIDEEKKLSLQNLFQKMDEQNIKEFPVIVKTDSFGSGEILSEILMKMSRIDLKLNIVHNSIGNISESDILLASSSSAVILGFNVKAPQKVLAAAKREGIEIKLYSVIYHLIEELEKAIKGEIEPVFVESKIGLLEVLQKFKISKIGTIAGCVVREGKITNKSLLKVFRNDDLVFEGEIETLKRVADEVKEVKAGTECGVRVKNFNSIEVGDNIEVYELRQKE